MLDKASCPRTATMMKHNAGDMIKREPHSDDVTLADDMSYHDEEYGLVPAIKVSFSEPHWALPPLTTTK